MEQTTGSGIYSWVELSDTPKTILNDKASLTSANTFSSTNTFNSFLPTSTITASSANQFVNYTTLTSQGYTTLALVQSNVNTFTGSSNTFSNPINANGQINLKNNLLLYDLIGLTNYHRLYQSGQIFSISPTGGVSTTLSLSCLNAGGSNVETLKLTSDDATITGNASVSSNLSVTGTSTLAVTTFSGNATFNGTTNTINNTCNITSALNISATTNVSNNMNFSQATINLNSSGATHNVNLFNSITSGTIGFCENLASSICNMFSTASTSTLNLNAKVKFRQVKLYNEVQTTAGGTLTFPLSEFIMITGTGAVSITLPTINSSTQLGMTFTFNKARATTNIVTFTAQGTNTIVPNGSITGTTSNSTIMIDGVTSVEFAILEQTAGVYNWVQISYSTPQNPVGSIITMPVNSLPAGGYLFCNGASLSTTGIYSNLFGIIAYTYGGSGGSFNIPNFNNGSFLRGFGGNSASIGTQQAENIKTHTHDIKFGYNQAYQGTGGGYNAYSSTAPNYNNPGGNAGNLGAGRVTTTSELNTAGSPDETRVQNYSVYYCIKY